MTRKQRVESLLRRMDWVPNHLIQSVEYGGSSGLRRLRELRKDLEEDGETITEKRLVKDGKSTGTFLYKITKIPERQEQLSFI